MYNSMSKLFYVDIFYHRLIFSEKLEKDSELNAVRTILVAENFSKLLPVIFFRLLVISSVLFIDLIYLSEEVTFLALFVCLSVCHQDISKSIGPIFL